MQAEASNVIISLQHSFDKIICLFPLLFPLLGTHSSCHCISDEPLKKTKKQTTQENPAVGQSRESATPPSKYELL